MNHFRSFLNCAVLAGGLMASPALAQSVPPRGGVIATYEAGYANGRQMETRSYAPSSRTSNDNRLIVNGIIQHDSNAYFQADGSGSDPAASGADYFSAGAGSQTNTAIGNLLTVSVVGSWNTVIVNSEQANTGTITANGNPPR